MFGGNRLFLRKERKALNTGSNHRCCTKSISSFICRIWSWDWTLSKKHLLSIFQVSDVALGVCIEKMTQESSQQRWAATHSLCSRVLTLHAVENCAGLRVITSVCSGQWRWHIGRWQVSRSHTEGRQRERHFRQMEMVNSDFPLRFLGH